MTPDETYMSRCLELAGLGRGNVSPNPMVGAVLIHNRKIIGEGYHQRYGEAHAEVNCLNSVNKEHHDLIKTSTLYVSLEPCAHYGKTPPCTDLIIRNQIPKVVVGIRDPFIEVNGRGIEKLKDAGIDIVENVLVDECYKINKRFFTFHQKKRPYIILKWAQSFDGKISKALESTKISNEYTDRMVHKWRGEESAIMVGTNTVMIDDPNLTNRLWSGNGPVRLIVDMDLKIPLTMNIFDGKVKTIVFNKIKEGESGNITFRKILSNSIQDMLSACYDLNIQSILVEGGSKLLQSFIDENVWDEARIISNKTMLIESGVLAPLLSGAKQTKTFDLLNDQINIYYNNKKASL